MEKIYTIRLDGIYLRAYHGCYDLEQQVGNRFRVDMAIRTPLNDLPTTDDVTRAVNYLTVYEAFPEIVEVECTVAKLAPPLGGKIDKVSVTLIG